MIEYARRILGYHFFYELFHKFIGVDYRNRVLVDEYLRLRPGDSILDIGCGPGNMVPFLPPCTYLGVDASPQYIAAAQRRYGHRGKFICEQVKMHHLQEIGSFDVVLASGLVHHLDDSEAADLFRLGYEALVPAGRMITVDVCIVPGQSAAKRYFLSRDRGQFVRQKEEYVRLAAAAFSQVRPTVREDVLRLPNTTLFMECTK